MNSADTSTAQHPARSSLARLLIMGSPLEAQQSAAVVAIADRVAPELNASYIIPSVFDSSVAGAVAHAVREAEAQ